MFGLRSVRQPLTNIKQFKWLLDCVAGRERKCCWGELRHRNNVKKPEKQAYHLAQVELLLLDGFGLGFGLGFVCLLGSSIGKLFSGDLG